MIRGLLHRSKPDRKKLCLCTNAILWLIIPIIYEGILTGFKTINSNIIDSTKLLSNINLTVLFNIHIPLAMPSLITSLIQSFGLGLKVLVMSEVIVNPPNSIGRLIGEYAIY